MGRAKGLVAGSKGRLSLAGLVVTGLAQVVRRLERSGARTTYRGRRIRLRPERPLNSLRIFRDEMKDLGNERPVILAYGKDAYRIARTHLRPEEYSLLIKLTHYSDYRLNKEAYKQRVFEEIAAHRESSAKEMPCDMS